MSKKISKLTKIQKEIESIKNLISNYNDKLKLLETKEKEEITLEKNKLITNLSLEELEQAILLLEIEKEQEQEKEQEKNLEESQDNNVEIIEENNIGGDNFDHNNNY